MNDTFYSYRNAVIACFLVSILWYYIGMNRGISIGESRVSNIPGNSAFSSGLDNSDAVRNSFSHHNLAVLDSLLKEKLTDSLYVLSGSPTLIFAGNEWRVQKTTIVVPNNVPFETNSIRYKFHYELGRHYAIVLQEQQNDNISFKKN